jgi:hypothetical protein
MMLTVEEWLRIMENYGAKIWPAQIVFYVMAILLTVWLFIRPGRIQNLLIKLYLCMTFMWIGIAFYFVFARGIAGNTYGNYIMGAFFIIISVLFAVDIFRNKMHFLLPAVRWQRYSTLVLTILAFSYPWIGITLGHRFPNLIITGTLPCPTITLSLILLTTSLPRVNKTIYVLLLFLAIPFTPFMQILKYGVYEDIILFATGIYSLILLIKHWKIKNQRANSA